ncbi:MAG TPA: hypothetical protein VF587_17095 [Solirubrobacteraceae bacterium]
MLRAPAALLAAAAALALAAPSAHAQRPVAITSGPSGPVTAEPLLVDMTADVVVRGRAAARAAVDVSATCSLRVCAKRVYANRRGRWAARLHVVVPPDRTTLFVRAGYPLAEARASRTVRLEAPDRGPTRPELALIGDSLAQGTAPYLDELLPDWRVTVDAAKSRFLLEGIAIRETMRKPARRPVVLAFSLFTNDHPSRAAELAYWARQSLAGLPDGSCVIWATIVRPKVGGVSYAQANRLLEQAARDEPRILVVPWARAVRNHRDWLRGDGVHATEEGYRARAEMYAALAESCPGVG